MKLKEVKEMAYKMRRESVEMAYNAGGNGAHLGGGLSCIEILAVLYGKVARLSDKPDFFIDDHILISKAHAVLAYYSALHNVGYLSDEDIASFEQSETYFPGHPLKQPNKGIDYAGGSLGMALSVGVGMALHDKRLEKNNISYVILGDGECEEGSVWEAVIYAAYKQLDNLVVIIDRNVLQYDGTTEEVCGLGDFETKFDAFGWKCVSIDGHNVEELEYALMIEHNGSPLLIVANTVKGKGVSFMENKKEWHHSVLSYENYIKAIEEIEKDYYDTVG